MSDVVALYRTSLERRGVYLWGAVGRGKSFLMDSFCRCVPLVRKRRVQFVMTSNYHPDLLYPHGLQRERFLPAIGLLKDVEEEQHPLDVEGRRIPYRKRAGGLVWFDFAALQSAEYLQAERRNDSGGSGKVQGLPA